MSTFPDGLYHYGGVPVGGDLTSLAMGNVYFVLESSNAAYDDIIEARQGIYHNDGSWRCHTTIQSALDATVANRNDYVIVLPDNTDYDITATLTMTKNRTHLVAPSGYGTNGFPNNSVRLHQTTAATALITVTGDCVEIGGFFFKHMTDSSGIVLSSTRWSPIIHNNFFGMACADTGSAAYGVGGTGAISHASIFGNYFTNYSPGLMTGTNNAIAAFINLESSSCTRNLIRDNIMHTGVNTTVGAGILAGGNNAFVIGNYIFEDVAGVGDAGIFTLGISTGASAFVADNRIGIVTAASAVAGGTADSSYCQNFEASSGGTVAT